MKLLLLIASVLLAACATPIEQQAPQSISSAVEVKDTAFDKDITYTGPVIYTSSGDNDLQYLLRAWKNKKTDNTGYQLYIDVSYADADWRSYESASFTSGSTVNAATIDNDVYCGAYGCTYYETLGIPVTAAFLNRKSVTGFNVRLNSHSGQETFVKVSPNYIQGFMQAVGTV
ncbi:MAG TPA: hypothetical protein VKB53_01305 [Gammaproteobacteria bacterium]|nr:hypothetical protein [Gammaproteobacteria bacterium]